MKYRARPRLTARVPSPGPPLEPLSLSLFNGFELWCGDHPISVPVSAERVVAFLALHPGSQDRSYVAGTLWPDTSDNRAAARLRTTLWRARQNGCPVVDASMTRLQLAPSVRVDVQHLLGVVRRVFDRSFTLRPADRARLLAPAELLPGWYEDWVLIERERVRQLRLHALEILCERLTVGRQFGSAVDAALAAIQEEPLRESAHRVLIRAYLAEGNVSEALQEYRRYRGLLRQELGVGPSSEMEELLSALPVR
jgi:DNA-binding SARP family transcriptional activator